MVPSRTAVVIPAFEPTAALCSFVEELFSEDFGYVIVIDDGSGPTFRPVFDECEEKGAIVISYEDNAGKGHALKQGLSATRLLSPAPACVVTADCDGQHLVYDIESVVRECGARNTLVLGTRDFSQPGVPARSRFGNKFSSIYFRLATGRRCHDTQTGLRALSSDLIDWALSIPGERYDYEMHLLMEAVDKATLRFVPIETVYEDGNSSSHFSTVRDSAIIYAQPLKFAASSASCALVDLSLFAILEASGLFPATAVIAARMTSGALNFTINRNWSFSGQGSRDGLLKGQSLRYIALFLSQMAASACGTTLLSLACPALAAKIVVDGLLFIVSYMFQRRWVFAKDDGDGQEWKEGENRKDRSEIRGVGFAAPFCIGDKNECRQ